MKKTLYRVFEKVPVLWDIYFVAASLFAKILNKRPYIESVAIDAYIYGHPIVLTKIMEGDTKSAGAPTNQFIHQRSLSDSGSKISTYPSVDTIYSIAWLDLSNEPLILHVPDTNERYYILQMIDCWTNTFYSISPRTSKFENKNFIVIGPEWKGEIPKEFIPINSPTNNVWILGRIQIDGTHDSDIIHTLQTQFTLTTLSLWNTDYTPSDLKPSNLFDHPKIPPRYQIDNMDAKTFFQTLSLVINKNPLPTQDALMRKKLAKIGIIRGKDLNFSQLNTKTIHALNNAILKGSNLIKSISKKRASIKGWEFSTQYGAYGTNYFRRAIVALNGFANFPQDAVYAPAFTDSNGQHLNGKYNYVIHFDKNKLPPVNAFWSITLYNKEGFLVENSINRYSIGSHFNSFNFNTDGSLDIYIQHASLGKDKEANWLPSPTNDEFNFLIRLYWPKSEVLNGTWEPPAIKRAD